MSPLLLILTSGGSSGDVPGNALTLGGQTITLDGQIITLG